MDPSQMNALLFGLGFGIVVVFALGNLTVFVLIGIPWLRALLHGTPVSLPRIIAIRLRGNSPALLIDAYTTLIHSSVPTTIDAVERTYLESKSRVMTSQDLVDIMKTKVAEP